MTYFEKQFVELFSHIAPHYRRSEVFYDFITISGLALYFASTAYQACDDTFKDRYQHARKRYSNEEFTQLTQLFAVVVEALTEKRYDFLGTVFMHLNLGDGYKGQYFTPQSIAEMMAKITLSNCHKMIEQKGYIALSEPACGSGVMIIASVNYLMAEKFNPQQQLWVHCQDVDFSAAMMCYIQLSLLHIPACVSIGDSLSHQVRTQFFTLAHWIGGWQYKLAQSNH